MAEADENSLHSNSHIENDESQSESSLITGSLALDAVRTEFVSEDTNFSETRVMFKKIVPSKSKNHANVQRPWGSGSPSRDSNVAPHDVSVPRLNTSNKCYRSTDLSTPSRTSEANGSHGKKSLVQLGRVTKFPMASLSSSSSTRIFQ
jgi:hypothetical protein